jgi:formylglycine-generating enzyme required for sulfatase activity
LTVTREADWKWAISSEDEWYKAAYYKGGSTNAGYWCYATRSNNAPGRDMTEATKPGNNANYGGFGTSPYPIDLGKLTTLVGEFQLSVSAYGTFDQDGNVYEWNESIIDGSYSSFSRGARGGSFGGTSRELSTSYRYDIPPTIENSAVGFRVASVPEPSSIAMLGIALTALLYWWRTRA